jgi:hypothetical protein
VVAIAGATNVDTIEHTVTAVVVVLAVCYVASDIKIDFFHKLTSQKLRINFPPLKLLCEIKV